MKKTLLKRQIPTIVGLLVLFIGAGAGVILVGSGTDFLPRAGPEATPKNLEITNVTDQSFTVSWVTDEATVGFVRYGESASVSTTATDERDQLSGDTGSFRVHHVTVRGLSESTKYYFKVGSGTGSTLFDDKGKPYELTTGPSLSLPEESTSLFGKVMTTAQTPAEGSIVYIQVEDAAPLSTMVKSSGSWALSLATLRSKDLKSYFQSSSSDSVTFKILGTDGSITTGLADLNTGESAVPTITLGTSFDFRSQQPAAAKPAQTATPATQTNVKSEIELLNPSYDGEQINSTRPEIQGSAPPNTLLEITVESPETYEDTFTTDSLGGFSWSPPEDLEPGEHTVTISWLDTSGVRQFFQRQFVVLAQGESAIPALTATPSATPATPTPRPSATPLAVTSPTPSPTASPTPVPSASPTPTPTARATQVSTESSVPVAGSMTQTLWLLVFGSLFIGSGVLLSSQLKD